MKLELVGSGNECEDFESELDHHEVISGDSEVDCDGCVISKKSEEKRHPELGLKTNRRDLVETALKICRYQTRTPRNE